MVNAQLFCGVQDISSYEVSSGRNIIDDISLIYIELSPCLSSQILSKHEDSKVYCREMNERETISLIDYQCARGSLESHR